MNAPPDRLAAALADQYRIERELGAGGMATVYLAHDVRHDRKVAVKVLRPELAAVIGAERFLAEIKTTANLQHPHILALFDSGTVDGTVFYVMPYVEGESLRDRVAREKQLPVDDALRIAHEVADALQYAHEHGIIHRDIKPENILLHGGHALVADFGIALAASKTGGTRMTETGMSLGTPHYMSPEQAMGERELDARTDIYALGCVTYEMLTGEPPFSGATAQAIVARVLTESPRSITAQRRTIPPHVEAAILRSLEKLPADRFASAAEFDRALTTAGAPARVMAKARTAFDWRVALASGLVIGAAGAYFLAGTRRAAVSGEVGARQQMTFNGRAWRPAISPDGAFVAFTDVECEHAALDLCRYTLMVQEAGSAQAVPVVSGAISLNNARWTHDGSALVISGRLDAKRVGLFAVPRLGGAPRSLGEGGAFDTHPAGDTVVVVHARSSRNAVAFIIALATGSVVDSVPMPFTGARDIAWSPNGRFFAVATTDRRTMVVTRDGKETGTVMISGRPRIRWNVAGDGVLQFRSAPVKEDNFVKIRVAADGRVSGVLDTLMARVATFYQGEFDIARRTGRMILATGDAIADVWSFDLATSAARATQRTRGTTWYGGPAIAPDGQSISYYRGDALGDNVYALSLKDGTEEALTTQRRPGGSAVRFSPDGRRLAYSHAGENGRLIELLEFPSRKTDLRQLPTSGVVIWPIGVRGFLDASADFSHLMVADSFGGAWRDLPFPDSLSLVAWAPSPDSKRAAILAIAGDGKAVLGTQALSGGPFMVSVKLDREIDDIQITWDRDGSIYLPRWLPTDEKPSLWAVMESTGILRRVATMPVPCDPNSVFVSWTYRLATCLVPDFRSDVWTIDGVGKMR